MNKATVKIFIILIIVFSLSACSRSLIQNYTADYKSWNLPSNIYDKMNISISNPSFMDTGTGYCRGGLPIKIAENITYTKYIADALKEELQSLDIFDEKSKNIISIKLMNVFFSSKLHDANWTIDGQYTYNEKTVEIHTVHEFETPWNAGPACKIVSLEFPAAVSRHLKSLMTSKLFQQ